MALRELRNLLAAAGPEERDGQRGTLSAVPLCELHLEARRRGFELLPAGVFRSTAAELEAFAGRERDAVDGWPLIDELAKIAGTDFPAAVEEIKRLAQDNAELRKRADVAEFEAALLRAMAVEDAVARFERGGED